MSDTLLRYMTFFAVVIGSAALAVAAIAPDDMPHSNPDNVTVIYKTTDFPVSGPIVLESCAVEDCSDTVDG
jgi:hypothetical protein